MKKNGDPVNIEVSSFLTTTPNPLVETINHERMPVLLTHEHEFETWLDRSDDDAMKLARQYLPLNIDGSSVVLQGGSGGYVAIGQTSQVGAGKFGIVHDGSVAWGIAINNTNNGNGQVFEAYQGNGTTIGSVSDNGGTGVVYNTTSDRRIKENIATTTLGLDQLMEIPVREFSFIKDPAHATTTGFIAQSPGLSPPTAITASIPSPAARRRGA